MTLGKSSFIFFAWAIKPNFLRSEKLSPGSLSIDEKSFNFSENIHFNILRRLLYM